MYLIYIAIGLKHSLLDDVLTQQSSITLNNQAVCSFPVSIPPDPVIYLETTRECETYYITFLIRSNITETTTQSIWHSKLLWTPKQF